MKELFFQIRIVLVTGMLFTQVALAQGVGINTSGTNPDPSAILDASSTSQGFLPPRMNSAQRDSISLPAEGLMIYNTDLKCVQFNKGTPISPFWICTDGTHGCGTYGVTFEYKGSIQHYGTVVGSSGKCWLDRNLGASRVAQSFDDTEARGDLFQWGRGDDGHQNRTSPSNTTQSSSLTPGNNFIRSHTIWYIGNNPDDLWQGLYSVNNPCPQGWRLPTQAEFQAENITDRQTAFASTLRLPVGGFRSQVDANIYNASSEGYYWTSTINVSNNNINRLQFTATGVSSSTVFRAHGMSVRCIKD
jgi:uncharacterized protein (TIGR02145 family)